MSSERIAAGGPPADTEGRMAVDEMADLFPEMDEPAWEFEIAATQPAGRMSRYSR